MGDLNHKEAMAADLRFAAAQQRLRLIDAWKNVDGLTMPMNAGAPASSEGWTTAPSSMSLDYDMDIGGSVPDLPDLTQRVFDGSDSSYTQFPALSASGSGTGTSAFDDSSRARLASPPPHILPSTFADSAPVAPAPGGPSAFADIPAQSRPTYVVPPPLLHVRPPPAYASLAPPVLAHPSSTIFPSISTSTSTLHNYPNPNPIAPIYRPLPLPSVPISQPHRPDHLTTADPPFAVDADTAISKRLSGLEVDEPVSEEQVGRAWSRAVQNRERRRASFALDGWGFGAGC